MMGAAAVPEYLTALRALQLTSFAVFPIIVNHLVSGALVLAYRLGKAPSPNDIASARRLADQVAVAFANNRAIEARVRAQMELVGAVEAKHEAEERATVLQAEKNADWRTTDGLRSEKCHRKRLNSSALKKWNRASHRSIGARMARY